MGAPIKPGMTNQTQPVGAPKPQVLPPTGQSSMPAMGGKAQPTNTLPAPGQAGTVPAQGGKGTTPLNIPMYAQPAFDSLQNGLAPTTTNFSQYMNPNIVDYPQLFQDRMQNPGKPINPNDPRILELQAQLDASRPMPQVQQPAPVMPRPAPVQQVMPTKSMPAPVGLAALRRR